MKDIRALQRLNMMGDWLKLGVFDARALLSELEPFRDHWRPYNPRKKIPRFGLSVTSLDGKLSGIPDLDSLYEYNLANGTSINNSDIRQLTVVYRESPTLQDILKPYLPWLGRCHFIKLNQGGFFPEHQDIDKTTGAEDEIRLIGFVHNSGLNVFKFCYEDRLITNIRNGDFFYFNANKHHSVFSMADESIQLVVTLRFDEKLFDTILTEYEFK